MQNKPRLIAALAAAAMLVGTRPAAVSAAPQIACSLLTIAEVRTIIGSPVDVFAPSSSPPTVHGDHTDSGCVYMPPGRVETWKGAGSGFVFLMWGPRATLAAGRDVYVKRHWLARIKGDVLATATVSKGKVLDAAASNQLLEAILKKV